MINKQRKMVIDAIQEYLSGRNLHDIEIIENDIETVSKIITNKIQKFESTATGIGLRIIKAEIKGLEQLLQELQSNLVTRQEIQIDLITQDIIDDEDIKTPQMVKLIIKTYLNLESEKDEKRKKEILVGFRLSASREILRYAQGRGKMTPSKADSIATNITDCYFETNNEKSNSRKYKVKKFLTSPFGGYIK